MQIKVMPDRLVEAELGENLLRVLVRQGVAVKNTCSGNGTCGKCKVRLAAGVPAPSERDRKFLTEAEIAAGVRLACGVGIAPGMEVEVDAEVGYDRKEAVLRNAQPTPVNTGLRKVFFKVPQPSLADERGDWDRVRDCLSELTGQDNWQPNKRLLQALPGILRAADFQVTAVIWQNSVLALEPGDTTGTLYGIALDIGTTSVCAALVDLASGQVARVVSAENGQTRFGADVISRITYAREARAQAQDLHGAVLETINNLINELSAAQAVDCGSIYKLTLVGNTTMHHLFLGLDTANLAVSPFVSACNAALEFAAAELGLRINPQGRVLMFPNIGSFVGGDTVGAILGAPEVLGPGNHLLVDLGTNCELFLKTEHQRLACSTAAGPAFEGAGIAQGMRAKPGAIEGVTLSEDGVTLKVIDDVAPVGICGSGLIEGIHQLRMNGVISKQGAIRNPDEAWALPQVLRERIRQGKNGREFVLAYAARQGEADIVLTQKDIGELQLAKGAVCAGIKTILGLAGISLRELDSVVMAGTFASYLKARSIIDIGLVPDLPPEKIKFVGNAAHVGAIKALIDHREYMRAAAVAKEITHVELGGNSVFVNLFMNSMYLEKTTDA